jgi:hypothetical protein
MSRYQPPLPMNNTGLHSPHFVGTDELERKDWGHSSTFTGVDLAVSANVKQIAFFHHDPRYDDFKLVDIFSQTQQYLKSIAPESNLKMYLAYEDLTMDMIQDESSVQDELFLYPVVKSSGAKR